MRLEGAVRRGPRAVSGRPGRVSATAIVKGPVVGSIVASAGPKVRTAVRSAQRLSSVRWHSAVLHKNTVASKPACLFAVMCRPLRENDFPARAEYSVPRQMHVFRHVSQSVCSQPRTTGKPRHECHIAVGRYSSARNRCNHIPDPLKGKIRLGLSVQARSTTFGAGRPKQMRRLKFSQRHS